MYIFYVLEEIIVKFCSFMYLMLMIRILISWFAPTADNMLVSLVKELSDIIIEPIRRRGVGHIGGFDFSYLIAFFLISIIQSVLLRILYMFW